MEDRFSLAVLVAVAIRAQKTIFLVPRSLALCATEQVLVLTAAWTESTHIVRQAVKGDSVSSAARDTEMLVTGAAKHDAVSTASTLALGHGQVTALKGIGSSLKVFDTQ